ncbi:DUF6602 domain-containing protein [Pseudomonas sp. 22105]|jgi:hypothetical protein|uniref:DUF6602 domain-containing protein n=1 Tax=Pseudomonas TaxID=286 RepID=UPI00131F24C1|nr:DUF6602 domain-containing protein [Pseudomonas glycinae]
MRTTKHFDYIVNRIESAKKNADSLASGIGHHGIAGEIREIAAKECIEPFLTQSYQCGTGKVIDSLQSLSDQLDLIVYHRKVAPPILVGRDLGLYPVECVRYVFEIKSTLNAREIKDANKKFRSVSKLLSFPKTGQDSSVKGGPLPTTVLLAFSTDITSSEIERYKKHTADEHPPCTVLCVLGKGYWFYDAATKSWYGLESNNNYPPFFEFSMFITGLMNTLSGEETSIRPFNPGSYINVDDIILSALKPSQ